MDAELNSVIDPDSLAIFVAKQTPRGVFRPTAYLGESEDTLYCYFLDEPYFGERIDSQLTVYYSLDENRRLVGGQIKGVNKVVEALDEFGINGRRSGHEKLKFIFLGLYLGVEPDCPLAQKIILALAHQASEVNILFELISAD